MRLVIALALFSIAAGAQPPDAKTLVDQAGIKVKSFHTLQFIAENTMETAFPGAPMKMTTEVSSAYLNPGKMRMEIKVGGLTLLDVSDGSTMWVYNSMAKQYAKVAAAQGPAALMAVLGVGMPDMSNLKTDYKTLGEESIEVDGQKHDCWLVEMQIGEMTLPGQESAKMNAASMRWWIDKKMGLDLQMVLAMKMTIGGKDIEMHQTTLKKGLKFDEPIDDALFTFTPPPDAKEVKELKLFGTTMAKPDLAGKNAPAFEVKAMDGKAYSLASLKGKPVLLDFWATWCAPCRASMPALEKISRDLRDSDLVILGVDSAEDRAVVEKFLKETPLAYPAVLSGSSGILEAYQVTAYPTFILIGRDGKIVANEIGFSGEDQIREMIAKAGMSKH